MSHKTTANNPTISIITTVLNGAEFIEDTILSVINQTYENKEYIIIDGGSTDGTLKIIKKYEDKVDYLVSEPDNGIYYGMDKGIRAATGDFFCILNSDDYFVHESVLSEVAHFIKHNSADFYFGDVQVIDRETQKVTKKSNSNIKSIRYRNSIPHPGLFAKTKDYIMLNGFDFDFKIAADYDFVIRLIVNGFSGAKLDICVANRRKGGYSSKKRLANTEGLRVRKKNKVLSVKEIYLIYIFRTSMAFFRKLYKAVFSW